MAYVQLRSGSGNCGDAHAIRVRVTMKDRFRYRHIRGKLCSLIKEKINECNLKWYGHVLRKPKTEPVKCTEGLHVQARERGRHVQTSNGARKDMMDFGVTKTWLQIGFS